MKGAVVIALSTIASRSHGSDLLVEEAGSSEGFAGQVVHRLLDPLFGRALKDSPLEHRGLESTVLGKAAFDDPWRSAAAYCENLPSADAYRGSAPPRLLSARANEGKDTPSQPHFLARLCPSWKPDASQKGTVSSDPDSPEEAVRDNSSSRKKRQVVISPYKRERPTFDKDPAVERALKNTGVWRNQSLVGNVALCKGVMDVKATPGVVWAQLFDFSTYQKKVPIVSAAIVYKGRAPVPPKDFQMGLPKVSLFQWGPTPPTTTTRPERRNRRQQATGETRLADIVTGPGGVERFWVKFQSRLIPGITLTGHSDFTYDRSKNSVTWELDSTKKSSFGQVQGHWHIMPHPDGSSRSRVFYEMGLTVPSFLPRPIVISLSKTVVKEATHWLKIQSERDGGAIKKA